MCTIISIIPLYQKPKYLNYFKNYFYINFVGRGNGFTKSLINCDNIFKTSGVLLCSTASVLPKKPPKKSKSMQEPFFYLLSCSEWAITHHKRSRTTFLQPLAHACRLDVKIPVSFAFHAAIVLFCYMCICFYTFSFCSTTFMNALRSLGFVLFSSRRCEIFCWPRLGCFKTLLFIISYFYARTALFRCLP